MKAHATAVVEPGARIDPTVTIGAFCFVSQDSVLGPGVQLQSHVVLEGKIEISEGVRIGTGAIIQGPARIGPQTKIFPYAVIGELGQYPNRHDVEGAVEIDSGVVLREFVIVNKSVLIPSTRIGRGCYIMSRTQIDHDCILEPFVKAATGVTLGGSVYIEEHAYLGMNAVVHQGIRIGRVCMIGMNGAVTAHVPPFTTLINQRISRINTIGLKRIGASETDIMNIESFYLHHDRCNDRYIESNIWTDAIRLFKCQVSPDPVAKISSDYLTR